MSKKEIVLVLFVAILGGLYVINFTDWFKTKFIRIEHTVRSLREAWAGNGRRADPTGKQVNNVTFALHKDYRLTSVQVVPLAEARTNKYVHPLWHLVSKPGSPPVNALSYGMPVAGMTPSVANAEAEALEPGVEYRLLVEAGSLRGTNDFNIPANSTARR